MLPRVFAAIFGAFLGLTLLRFGNPPILEEFVKEWIFAPALSENLFLGGTWPIAWAYRLLALTAFLGLLAARWTRQAPLWVIALPLLWLIWQLLASTTSAAPELSIATLKHFAACVTCFYLGFFSLGRVPRLLPFWLGLLCGFLLVLAMGLDQHFGGLEESRKYIRHQLELYPQLEQRTPPELLKRMSSNRIYATLFYPNALAGALLLLLPAMLAAVWRICDLFRAADRSLLSATLAALGITAACLYLYVLSSTVGWMWILVFGLALLLPLPKWLPVSLLALVGLAALYWSGSKGGWLLMLVSGLLALLRLPLGKNVRIALITCILLGGLAGFFLKYAGFFQKGATSVSARFDYWRASVQTAKDKPLFGTGPGTFAIPYQKIKRPESEMARLVHNDYLEQASDSGVPGFLAYTLFIVAALVWSFPRRPGRGPPPRAEGGPEDREPRTDWQRFSIWLGVLGWALQGLLEFGLYIPALAWPAFALLGWLLAQPRNPIDKATPAG